MADTSWKLLVFILTVGSIGLVFGVPCPKDWKYYEGSKTCFKWRPTAQTHDTAITKCVTTAALKGTLGALRTLAEDDWVAKNVMPDTPTVSSWLGMKAKGSEYFYTDQTKVTWFNTKLDFSPTPVDPLYFCISYKPGTAWKVEACTEKLAYFCEMLRGTAEPAVTTTTPATPTKDPVIKITFVAMLLTSNYPASTDHDSTCDAATVVWAKGLSAEFRTEVAKTGDDKCDKALKNSQSVTIESIYKAAPFLGAAKGKTSMASLRFYIYFKKQTDYEACKKFIEDPAFLIKTEVAKSIETAPITGCTSANKRSVYRDKLLFSSSRTICMDDYDYDSSVKKCKPKKYTDNMYIIPKKKKVPTATLR